MALLLLRSARAGVGLGTSLRLAAVSSAQPGTAAATRCLATQADVAGNKGGSSLPWILALGGAGAGMYFAKEQGYFDSLLGGSSAPSGISTKAPPKPDYAAVKAAISDMLEKDDYDDGSYGPVFVRLAWHASGTYDKNTNTGGSNGATMRFLYIMGCGATFRISRAGQVLQGARFGEGDYAANAGLKVARDVLEPVKNKFPWISYADLWTLAGATAIEDMGGPEIKWRPGRSDAVDGNNIPPDGRLPDASKDSKHIRWVFDKMGFNDQEMVALSGAHALGRCHSDRSGYDGPWTNAPTTFSNQYFVELFENKWTKKKWKGPLQYEDSSKQLMMLPTDMAPIWDKNFRKTAEVYWKDGEKFAADFADAFAKLLELGVPFPEEEPVGQYVAAPGERPKGETSHATH